MKTRSDQRNAGTVSSLAKRLVRLSAGRDEMNLCEFPFATLSERSSGRNRMRFEIEEFDPKIRQMVRRALTVKGDPEFGLPTQKDEEIYLGLMKYSYDYNGFSDAEVKFSRTALFELMGWQRSKWAYDRLAKGLHRLVGVRLSYENHWRDNADKQWRDQGAFGILDSFELRDSKAAGNTSTFAEHHSMFRWGAVLFRSFDSGYLKKIDYELARSLSPKARRLYRYLDKHFHPPHNTKLTLDVARLGYQHIGISPNVDLDKVIKRHLAPASEELVSAGYLRPSVDGRFRKLRAGHWEATFQMASASPAPSATVEAAAPTDRLARALCKRGVSASAAVLFIASHTPEEIKHALLAMDEAIQNKQTIRSADKWLKAALTNGYRASAAVQLSLKRPERKVFRANR
jgi:hypothetical protein